MSTAQFCVSSDAYKSNICNGLTSLQQHEEFVDMTLAADGHFVKVHQIVVSLASPYLKQLILSAPCPHPVVFLNKISYPVLCNILEYIYTGEVMVNMDSMQEFVTASKELHITGLENMNLQHDTQCGEEEEEFKNFSAVTPSNQSNFPKIGVRVSNQKFVSDDKICLDDDNNDPFAGGEDCHSDGEYTPKMKHEQKKRNGQPNFKNIKLTLQNPQKSTTSAAEGEKDHKLQFTLSIQGHIQLILNRYMYSLYYTHKNSTMRSWKCVDAKTTKCRATVLTKDDIVIRRNMAHTHGFHDKRIMKKLQNNAIFTAIKDAEAHGDEANKSQQA